MCVTKYTILLRRVPLTNNSDDDAKSTSIGDTLLEMGARVAVENVKL